MAVVIRTADADDWKPWSELRLTALKEAPDAFGSRLADWADAEEARWRARMSIAGGVNLVASVDGKDRGMVSGVPISDDPESAELISMWVDPVARDRGVAQALIGELIAWASRSGFRLLQLSVRATNHSAIRLYERLGFRATGRVDTVTLDGGRTSAEIRYGLVLRSC